MRTRRNVCLQEAARRIERMIAEVDSRYEREAEAADSIKRNCVSHLSGFKGLLKSVEADFAEAGRLFDGEVTAGVRFHLNRALANAQNALARTVEAAECVNAMRGDTAVDTEGGYRERDMGNDPESALERLGACLAHGDIKILTNPLAMAFEDIGRAYGNGDPRGLRRMAGQAVLRAHDLAGFVRQLCDAADLAFFEA